VYERQSGGHTLPLEDLVFLERTVGVEISSAIESVGWNGVHSRQRKEKGNSAYIAAQAPSHHRLLSSLGSCVSFPYLSLPRWFLLPLSSEPVCIRVRRDARDLLSVSRFF